MHPTTPKWRNMRKNIGANIQHYRMTKRLTNKKLSDLSGVACNVIDCYELGKGQANLQILITITTAMQIDIRRLFERLD